MVLRQGAHGRALGRRELSLSKGERRARLAKRARAELPHPGDPRLLLEDLLDQELAGPEALEVLGRTSLAHRQLRDLGLERAWQGGFGWFLARNLMLFGLVALVLVLGAGLPVAVLEAALAGAALYYVIVMALMPRRLKRHGKRREGILRAYSEDLGAYLDELEGKAPRED